MYQYTMKVWLVCEWTTSYLDVRVAEAVGIHGDEIRPADNLDVKVHPPEEVNVAHSDLQFASLDATLHLDSLALALVDAETVGVGERTADVLQSETSVRPRVQATQVRNPNPPAAAF